MARVHDRVPSRDALERISEKRKSITVKGEMWCIDLTNVDFTDVAVARTCGVERFYFLVDIHYVLAALTGVLSSLLNHVDFNTPVIRMAYCIFPWDG